MKKIKKKQLQKFNKSAKLTVQVDFTDGRRLNIQTDESALPRLNEQLMHRVGSVTTADGQVFKYADMIHFEVIR